MYGTAVCLDISPLFVKIYENAGSCLSPINKNSQSPHSLKIRLFGGKIDISSAAGKGPSVTVVIPLYAGDKPIIV